MPAQEVPLQARMYAEQEHSRWLKDEPWTISATISSHPLLWGVTGRVPPPPPPPWEGPHIYPSARCPPQPHNRLLVPTVSTLPARDPCCEHPKWGVHPRDGSSQGPHAKISPRWLPSKSRCLTMQTSEDILDTAAQEWNWADAHTCSRRALLNYQIIKSRNSSKRCHSFITCWDTISKETFI